MKSAFVLTFILGTCLHTFSQTGIIKGMITTNDRQPAAHVNVMLKETNQLIMSKENGGFRFEHLKEGSFTIIVSYAGLHSLQKKVHVRDGATSTLDFILVENESQLAEYIVVSSKTLNEKPVQFGKIAIKPIDLPQSIAVIGKDVLERQQTLRLSEALMNVNGVYVMGTTGGGQEELAGRGYAYNSSNTFKNGTRYNNSALPEMSSLERIEVIKGSAAILFGNVTAGGVINLVTKKPRFEQGGEISMRIGSYDFYKPSLDFYGPVNNKVAYRINSTYEKSGSFRDVVQAERFYINPSFFIKAGKKTDVLLEADYLKDDRTSDFGIGAISYTLPDIPRNTFMGAQWSYYNTEQKSATATITHRLNNNWELRSITAYQHFKGETFGTTRPNSGNFIQSNGTWIRGLQRSGTDENYYITQLDLTGRFKTGKISHSLLLGADIHKYETDASAYAYINSNISGNNKNIYDTINIYNVDISRQRNDIPTVNATTLTYTPAKRAGAYVQDLIGISDKLKVLAGVRYSYQETGGGYIYSYASKVSSPVVLSTDQAFTPRLGLVYQPVKTISLFTSYANSFTLNTGTDVYLQPLDPSYINQYEAGIKTELFEKYLSFNVTAYKIVNSNLAQASLQNANGQPNNNSTIRELAGEVTSNGVEVDIMSKPVMGFSFIGGYSFNKTTYTKSNTYINGSRLRYNPRHTANASIYYTFNTSTLKGLNIGCIAYYVGKRVAGRSTRIQVPNDTYTLMPLPDYTQLDVTAGYTFQKISIRVKASNILNTLSYNVHDDNSVNPIAPRQLATTVSLKL